MSRAKPGKPSRRSVMRRSSCSRGGIAAWSGCHDPPASTRNALEGGAVNAPTRIDRIPDWPAMMTRQLAADYCCLSIAQFEREIVSGRLPAPVNLGGAEPWHKPTLDRYLEQIAGGATDWGKGSPTNTQKC